MDKQINSKNKKKLLKTHPGPTQMLYVKFISITTVVLYQFEKNGFFFFFTNHEKFKTNMGVVFNLNSITPVLMSKVEKNKP